MGFRISKLIGMDVYSDGGKYLGRCQDLILDLEKGEVLRLTLEPLTSVTREDAKRILRERSVLYKNVRSVDDVIMVAKGIAAGMSSPGEPGSEGEEAAAAETASASLGFFGRR